MHLRFLLRNESAVIRRTEIRHGPNPSETFVSIGSPASVSRVAVVVLDQLQTSPTNSSTLIVLSIFVSMAVANEAITGGVNKKARLKKLILEGDKFLSAGLLTVLYRIQSLTDFCIWYSVPRGSMPDPTFSTQCPFFCCKNCFRYTYAAAVRRCGSCKISIMVVLFLTAQFSSA